MTLWFVTALVFVLIHLAPGSPLDGAEDRGGMTRLSDEDRAELARLYRLDQPLHRQYAAWVGGVLRGDLGRSFHDRRPVADKIVERIGVTAAINGLALGLMAALALPLGALSAWRPGSRVDRYGAWLTYAAYAIPVFWAALLFQLLFAVELRWLPLAGLDAGGGSPTSPLVAAVDRLRHLVLPVVVLAVGGLAYLTRFVRAALLDSHAAENVVAARARGLSALAVLVRHGFRRAAIPMLTLAGLLLPAVVGGSVIVENVFAIPGLGRMLVDAAFQRDVPVLMALTLLSGVATLAGIVASDLAYLIVDPRIRRG
ncbi:MAG TPA: ABC transporter permease [Candidatus Polarisedimenticolaceae bacterium]|nr:ABC transporter permease [Candidatus Polarisedimenticolaceae bacterium]